METSINIECTKCKKNYKNIKTLEQHMKRMHNVSDVQTTPDIKVSNQQLYESVAENTYIPKKYIIIDNKDEQNKEIINYEEELIELKKRYNYLFNCILELNHYVKNVLLVENTTNAYITNINKLHPGLNITKDKLPSEFLEKMEKITIEEFNKGSFIPN